MLVTGELRELSCLSVLPAPLHIPPERVQTNLFATCQCAISDPPPFLFPFLPMFLFLKAPLGREEAIWVDGISPPASALSLDSKLCIDFLGMMKV